MDENNKTLVAYILASFIGCSVALLITAVVVIVVLFVAVGEAAEFGKDMAIREFEGLSIVCSKAYSAGALVLTLNGVAQYCSITERPKPEEFALDFT